LRKMGKAFTKFSTMNGNGFDKSKPIPKKMEERRGAVIGGNTRRGSGASRQNNSKFTGFAGKTHRGP